MNPSISRYERRDYIAELNRRTRWHWCIRFYGMLLALGLLAIYAAMHLNLPLPHASAAQADVLVNGVEVAHASFCRQAVLDHESWGRDLSPALKEYCGL